MLIQNVNEATLNAFCQTLTGTTRQWYQRLMLGMMDSFKQLSNVFSATFLNAKTQNKETSYFFRIKQSENEPLKGYLDRFNKAIMQVKNYSDDPFI